MKKWIWDLALAGMLLVSLPETAFPQWLNLKVAGTPRNADAPLPLRSATQRRDHLAGAVNIYRPSLESHQGDALGERLWCKLGGATISVAIAVSIPNTDQAANAACQIS